MKQWTTRPGSRISRVLSGRCNAYLISCGDRHVLVDTGISMAYSTLLRNLAYLGLKPDDLSWLILTHTHFDHCRSAARLKMEGGCRILMSGEAAGWTRAGYTPIPRGSVPATRWLARMGAAIGKRGFGYRPFEADSLSGPREFQPAGFDGINILSTPGHSADSVSIVIDNEIALVGDTLFGKFPGKVLPVFADDIPLLITSWKKLLDTGCTIFLPGHGREIRRELLEREYVRQSDK